MRTEEPMKTEVLVFGPQFIKALFLCVCLFVWLCGVCVIVWLCVCLFV